MTPAEKTDVVLLVPVHQDTDDQLRARYKVHEYFRVKDQGPALQAAFFKNLAHCEIVVTTGSSGIQAPLMQQLPSLRLVACFGVGVDGVDLAYARSRGIAVTNTPDVLSDEVADFAMALLLASLRQIPQADRFVRDRAWLKGPMPLTRSLQGKRIGIVGMGRIGKAIAKRCEAFGLLLGYHGPRAKPALSYAFYPALMELARWSDCLIVACPGGADTAGLVSRDVLLAMGPEGYLINISRGSVVDQQALVELLQSHALAGAGLDVFADEPHVPEALLAMPHVVLSPHVASASQETRTAMGLSTHSSEASQGLPEHFIRSLCEVYGDLTAT
ncbi:MAG: 2-hydroxyacid dehydrogenase [Betaproteobacteria bacterium]|nr:2-hydroxyacid dehydrogenase [Betaproteobacteria bacterium]